MERANTLAVRSQGSEIFFPLYSHWWARLSGQHTAVVIVRELTEMFKYVAVFDRI